MAMFCRLGVEDSRFLQISAKSIGPMLGNHTEFVCRWGVVVFAEDILTHLDGLPTNESCLRNRGESFKRGVELDGDLVLDAVCGMPWLQGVGRTHFCLCASVNHEGTGAQLMNEQK